MIDSHHNSSDHPPLSETKERVLTMMTALLYLERVSTADLCWGLGWDPADTHSRWEFAMFMAVGIKQMGWVEIDHDQIVTLTKKGVVMAKMMEQDLKLDGFNPRQVLDRALEDEQEDWAS